MSKPVERIHYPIPEDVSEVIDVRAPAEFADDHIPGAVSIPVFSDAERAEVGTMFKQESPFLARKLGAAIICRNISRHMENHFKEKPPRYAPLVYCWRGGQRSASLATILAAVGWRTRVLEGGYKTYRRAVIDGIALRCPKLTFRVLNGLTGSGKTRILSQLQKRGAQVLDLEDLASHKGSVPRPRPRRNPAVAEIFRKPPLAKARRIRSRASDLRRSRKPQSRKRPHPDPALETAHRQPGHRDQNPA